MVNSMANSDNRKRQRRPVENSAKRPASSKGGRRRKGRRKKISRRRKIIRRVILCTFLLIMLVAIIFGLKYVVKFRQYEKEAKRLVKEGGINAFKQNQTSTIYDKDGNVITELSGSHDSYYIESSDIPKYVKDAFIDTEDRNFYSHSGVDLKAIMRAFYELVRNQGKVTQGGSTITQQLARNVFLSHEVSMERKIKEMFIAREIEKKYSKKQILEFYINNIYFANGFYGIEAASKGYFSKSVGELSLGEIAYICSIPNNPTMYDPFVNHQSTANRKNRILKQMYKLGDITKEEYDQAVAEVIQLNPQVTTNANNYIETYAVYCAVQSLMAKNGFKFEYDFPSDAERDEYNEKYQEAYDQLSSDLYTGGYDIYTSIDMDKQTKLQEAIDTNLSGSKKGVPDYYDNLDDNGIYKFQGSATCIDNETGKIVAVVGGRSQQLTGKTLNRAYQSYRQPGSTIKPILVYTQAFEDGYIPRSTVKDEPIDKGPVNSPNVYDGNITIRYAVEKSKNTVAWNLFEELGVSECISYLKKMNFHKIVEKDYNASMAIGGMTYGVSTVEMASAYCAIENDGEFRSPTCINKIVDVNGNTVVDNVKYKSSKSSTVEVKKIYKTNAARMMTDVLKGVLVDGTGKKYNVDDAICAAKTGTTNDNKDVWLCGYSRYYTTAVWVGYDMPMEIDDGVGNTLAGYTWQDFMTTIHKKLKEKEFEDFDTDVDGKNVYAETEDESTTAEGETTTPTGETTSGETKTKTTAETTQASTESTSKVSHVDETTAPPEEKETEPQVKDTTAATEETVKEQTTTSQPETQAADAEPAQ